jgi:hypothetical protein
VRFPERRQNGKVDRLRCRGQMAETLFCGRQTRPLPSVTRKPNKGMLTDYIVPVVPRSGIRHARLESRSGWVPDGGGGRQRRDSSPCHDAGGGKAAEALPGNELCVSHNRAQCARLRGRRTVWATDRNV